MHCNENSKKSYAVIFSWQKQQYFIAFHRHVSIRWRLWCFRGFNKIFLGIAKILDLKFFAIQFLNLYLTFALFNVLFYLFYVWLITAIFCEWFYFAVTKKSLTGIRFLPSWIDQCSDRIFPVEARKIILIHRILIKTNIKKNMFSKNDYQSNEVVSKTLFATKFGSNRSEAFCKKVVLRNFAKLTGKHLCQSFFK